MLEVLLNTGEPLPPLAVRLTTLSLCSADDRERLLATDLLIAALGQGRIEAPALIDALRPDLPLVITSRLAAGLAVVASAGHQTAIRAALEGIIDALETLPARSRTPLLVLLDELCAHTNMPITDTQARAFLQTLTGSSQATRAAKSLLMRD